MIRLPRSTVPAAFPRQLSREMSESRRRPVVAPDAVLGNGFNTGRRGREIIFAVYRTIYTSRCRELRVFERLVK